MDKQFKVEILTPPLFSKSGALKDRKQAWKDHDWIGTFNLWIVQRNPKPQIVYQLRSPNIGWAPNKLDVAVGGHYENLENIRDGLREAKEELNKEYKFEDLIPIGRRLNVGLGTDGTTRNTVSDLFLIEDDTPLETYKLEEDEIFAICSCSLEELIKVHTQENYAFRVKALKYDKTEIEIKVTKDIFPPNWDDYHYKMVLLIKRYFEGEKELIY